MILYFADRQTMEIAGHASTALRKGFTIIEDLKTEDVETGVSSFEARITFEKGNRLELERMAEVGNYLLRSSGEFYTIVESEVDTKNQEVWIYAEDAGLDLINEIAAEFAAASSQPITYYVNMWIADSGFEIGLNECPDSTTRKLSWDGESTVTERLASIATQFGGYELSYSFAVDGFTVTNRYVNIHKKRGKDVGEQLRINKEIDSIITKKSLTNLATALKCTGGTPEDKEDPVTLSGYSYDDGDFYVKNSTVYSRKAAEKWGRFAWAEDINAAHDGRGYILRHYSFDTLDKATLCSHAIAELKKICDMEVNYEVDITHLPESVKVGDRINIIDDAGGLYLSTRVLQLKTSEVDQTKEAILGEYLIKTGGISQKVEELAAKFAETAQTSTRAYKIAEQAQAKAENAQVQADSALEGAEVATAAANEAKNAADSATEAAEAAQQAAENAQGAVGAVEESVEALEGSVANAQQAAQQAQQAAETADRKATEAQTAAENAQVEAENAQNMAESAQNSAENAQVEAGNAQNIAEQAKSEAEEAATTAAAAKLDAENAQKEIDELGEGLTTLSNTMSADYARKTDLTEAEAKLQTQITQNAEELSSTAKKVEEIDETANNAAEQAAQAQNTAAAAQAQADTATEEAEAAQNAANEAAAAATAAQNEADAAKAAAATAQSVADKAKADLEAAEADLATVAGRVDATEEDIQAAQEAVIAAQNAANSAQAEADAAAEKATTAQNTASTAVSNAAAAQEVANSARDAATAAQAAADKAQGDATAAQAKADEAAAAAVAAQNTANTAKTNADNAKTVADAAATAAANAQAAADSADAKAAQAAEDLAAAQQNLADVTGRVDATEEEVEAAKAAVVTAQAAAEQAAADAEAAQSTADTAKANAQAAQTAATNAKNAADKAQADAVEAQEAADKAQADVNALAVRVTEAETSIQQNAEEIALRAKKTEVEETLGGYYTKEEADTAIELSASAVKTTVSNTYATKAEVADIEIGGRNLLRYTGEFPIAENSNGTDGVSKYVGEGGTLETTENGIKYTFSGNANDGLSIPLVYEGCIESGEEITWSFEYRGNITKLGYFYLLQREYPNAAFNLDSITSLENSLSDWKKCVVTFVIPTANDRICYQALIFYATSYTSSEWVEIKKGSMKLEKGNKATDWTPAPEDLATNQSVDEITTETREILTENISQAIVECEEIILEALTSYTESGEYESFKETVTAQFELLSNQLNLTFAELSGEIDGVDADLQEKFNQISTFFTFNINGFTIGKADSPYTIFMDDNEFSMMISETRVLWFELTENSHAANIPELNVTEKFTLFGYLIDMDENGNVNCEYVGG